MFEQESINSYDQGESSFAERYMAESTAPAKRNDPGRRGAAPAVTVSIPYGEESGVA